MADCDPPEPPPLLREPPRKLPTAADRNAAERAEWEREQDSFWGGNYRWGCLVLIAVGLTAAGLAVGSPDDRLRLLLALAASVR